MGIPKLSELMTPPVVGKFYLIPCIQVPPSIRGMAGEFRAGSWLPILGTLHADLDIGNTIQHYHYDLRFCKTRIDANFIIAIDDSYGSLAFPTATTEIQLRRKKCQHKEGNSFRSQNPKIVLRLEHFNKTKKMEHWTCPHQNTPLHNIAINHSGDSITCPSHGLKWCIHSGKLIHLYPTN